MHSWQGVIQSIASGVGTAFIIYIAVVTRKGIKNFMGEHDWLMKTTATNTEIILELQKEIKDAVRDSPERRKLRSNQQRNTGGESNTRTTGR